MASDSSQCDSTCEGDNAMMCGGKSKNSLFSMHLCSDTESDLATAIEEATELQKSIKEKAEQIKKVTDAGEADANALQGSFGNAGDPGASDLMQEAKAWSGKLLGKVETANDFE